MKLFCLGVSAYGKIGRNPDFRRCLNHFDVQWLITPDNNVSEIINTIRRSVVEELKREYPDILKSDVTGFPEEMSVINEKQEISLL